VTRRDSNVRVKSVRDLSASSLETQGMPLLIAPMTAEFTTWRVF
jgi:hypothetical protein